MISQTDVVIKSETAGSPVPESAHRMGLISPVILSAWCGLLAGLLEVATMVVRKQVFDPDQFYRMSRHFVWLIPLSNSVFSLLGLLGWALLWSGRAAAAGCSRASMGALVILPSLLVAFPRIYSLAWLVVALGMAARLVPFVERHGAGFSALCPGQLPGGRRDRGHPGGIALGGRPLKQVRENARALAAAGVAERSLDRAGHRRGGPPEPAWVRPAHQPDPGRARRAAGSDSIPLGRPHPGHCHLMRACLRGDGCTNSRSAGSRRLTEAIPRWRSFSATGATRRPAFVANTGYCATIQGCPAVSRGTRITSSPSSPHSRRPCW